MALTFLIGGARSGKTALAVEMGKRHEAGGGAVTYVATAPITDADMAQRVGRHRDERPASWSTVEEKTDLIAAVESVAAGLVIIDCLTLWTSNLMWAAIDDDEIRDRADATSVVCASRIDPVVVITNEVGLGVHPESDLGRRYRDVLGRVNQAFARRADPALLLVAGRAVRLGDPWTHL